MAINRILKKRKKKKKRKKIRKAGDKEEEENPKDDDNNSNGSNNNMAALQQLPPFDNELAHVLTIVCGFPRDSNLVKAIKAFGLTTFDDFQSSKYDHKSEYEENNATLIVTGHNGIIMSAIIAFARDLEVKQHNDKDSPLNWTYEEFNI